MSCPLEPGDGVCGGADGRFQATTSEPWLHVAKKTDRLAGNWIRLRYRTGMFDDPIRPLIRFHLRDGDHQTAAMNGAVMGAAEWIGRVPEDTIRISICPAAIPGPFAFALDVCEKMPRPFLLLRGYLRHFWWTAFAVTYRLIGLRVDAQYGLQFAALVTPLTAYHRWRRKMRRPAEPLGLDRVDWDGAPQLHFLMPAGWSLPALETTLAALRRQHYAGWRLRLMVSPSCPADLVAHAKAAALADPRIQLLDETDPSWRTLPPGDLVACLQAGEQLCDIATGAVAQAARRMPQATVLYGDEDVVDADGVHGAPCFKPDYSPHFQSCRPYIGNGAFLRAGVLRDDGCESSRAFLNDEAGWLARLLSPTAPVHHVRRVLYHRPGPTPVRTPVPQAAPAGPWPAATIVIPTRDHADLLATCMEGLRTRTDYPDLHVVLLDNGSAQPEALALLDALAQDTRVTVLRCPEPFNFSALCNQGARATDAPLLVFMNNDMVVRQEDWLKRLAAWALQPDIGIVGAKLVYPDSRIQHAGDIIGIGKAAANAYKRAPDAGSYLDQLSTPHEMSAITGALMAVERRKFEAVGGFDAAAFPIAFSDTDFSLRMGARGWRNVVDPSVCLTHLESASRGQPVNAIALHHREQRAFRDRWMPLLRDDPCFHPAFSLWSSTPMLS